MRIVGGKYRGRVLNEFKGKDIRPTSDMTRESLFNILRFEIPDCDFLDLFCGTGAVGTEALSRGAERVVFNDSERSSLEICKSNLEKLKIQSGYSLSLSDGISFLENTSDKFNVIFIDPPYKTDLGERALNVCAKALKENGIAILENEKVFEGEASGLVKYDSRKYGRAVLTFFRKEKK